MRLNLNRCSLVIICFCAGQFLALGQTPGRSPERYYAVPLMTNPASASGRNIHLKWGVPFLEGGLDLSSNRPGRVAIGCRVKRIFLLGMTESPGISCWADPTNESVRCFIGDETGQIRLDYADGSSQVFPLVSGESIWWGTPFYRSPGPFRSDANFRKALASALRLYPPSPVGDGKYVAVIAPRDSLLQSITIETSPFKRMTPVITGITVEPLESNEIAGAVPVASRTFSPEFREFVDTRPLRQRGQDEGKSQRWLEALRAAFYTSDEVYKGAVEAETPPNYSGPLVSFQGSVFANILANAFSFNVQDIADKIDSDGMYHTSTRGALLWGFNGGQFGSFRANAGIYYRDSWSRDMGRSLQELTVLGYTNKPSRCADYCLRVEALWESNSAPRYQGTLYPPHWSRVANRPGAAPPYENDGHGLISMFLYKLWQRLPDRDEWLRARWPGVKAAGDWILWQFDHPEISGATNGVLHTTGECAGGNGYSVYGDAACLEALQALAQMADSIGQTNSAAQWRDRALKMREAIAAQYIVTDRQHGPVWTLASAGWPTHPTVLGPLIFVADYQGFAPEDDDQDLRPANEAAYQRLIDTYQPFGFYGQAMGYGQGFVTQSALLLDRMRDATTMLDWIAKQIYDPKYGSFVVPEGVQIEPGGEFWYRAGDLGNGVQEAEIVKVLRLVIGVDDTHPDRVRFYPRMPCGWTEMAVEKYPVLFERAGKMETARLNYKLERSDKTMKLQTTCDTDLGPVAMRLGPFQKRPGASSVWVNGKRPQTVSIQHSGDSWWAGFVVPIGPAL